MASDSSITTGLEAMQKLAEVLHLPRTTNRVVIDLQVNCVATAYVVQMMTTEQVDALNTMLGDLSSLKLVGDVGQ